MSTPERRCRVCGEMFEPEDRERRCVECATGVPEDLVDHFTRGASARLNAGLRELRRAGS